MPGWNLLPCSADDLINPEWFAELRAAIAERIDATSAAYPPLTTPAAVNSNDLLRWDTIMAYRWMIQNLLTKFYYQSGSGEDVTFTVWTTATMMTACFGQGVTNWPNANDKLLRASYWNDMRTVLNKMDWFSVSAAFEYTHCAGLTNSGGPILGLSKAEAQSNFDALDDEFMEYNESNFCGIEPVGYRWPVERWGVEYYCLAWIDEWVCRDNQAISSFAVPNAVFTDAYLGFYVQNYKGPTEMWVGEILAPSQPLTLTFYLGLADIPHTFGAIRSYGETIGSWTTSRLYGAPTLRYCQFSAEEFAGGDQNNIRLTGRATLSGELTNDIWWYSVGYCPHFCAGGNLYSLMLKAQFDYRAD